MSASRTDFDDALGLARLHPLGLGREVAEARPDSYPEFVSLAGWLQVLAGSRPVLLPADRVGRLLGVLPQTAYHYRRWAVRDGYLAEVGGRRVGRQVEFAFDVSRFPSLRVPPGADGTDRGG